MSHFVSFPECTRNVSLRKLGGQHFHLSGVINYKRQRWAAAISYTVRDARSDARANPVKPVLSLKMPADVGHFGET